LKWHDSQYLALKTADKTRLEQLVTPDASANNHCTENRDLENGANA